MKKKKQCLDGVSPSSQSLFSPSSLFSFFFLVLLFLIPGKRRRRRRAVPFLPPAPSPSMLLLLATLVHPITRFLPASCVLLLLLRYFSFPSKLLKPFHVDFFNHLVMGDACSRPSANLLFHFLARPAAVVGKEPISSIIKLGLCRLPPCPFVHQSFIKTGPAS